MFLWKGLVISLSIGIIFEIINFDTKEVIFRVKYIQKSSKLSILSVCPLFMVIKYRYYRNIHSKTVWLKMKYLHLLFHIQNMKFKWKIFWLWFIHFLDNLSRKHFSFKLLLMKNILNSTSIVFHCRIRNII